MRKYAYTAGALALAFAVTPALAHENDEVDTHAQAHQEHRGIHQDQAQEHARAHEDGFDSRWQHRAYHRALNAQHEEFHEDHPGTRHDHARRHRWWSYYWGN